MEEVLELKKQIKDADQKIQVLSHELELYQVDGPIGFYYELNRWINASKQYLKGKTVEGMMNTEKDDPIFSRTMALIKSTKENIETLSEMRGMFTNISGSEEDDKNKKLSFIDKLAIKRTS